MKKRFIIENGNKKIDLIGGLSEQGTLTLCHEDGPRITMTEVAAVVAFFMMERDYVYTPNDTRVRFVSEVVSETQTFFKEWEHRAFPGFVERDEIFSLEHGGTFWLCAKLRDILNLLLAQGYISLKDNMYIWPNNNNGRVLDIIREDGCNKRLSFVDGDISMEVIEPRILDNEPGWVKGYEIPKLIEITKGLQESQDSQEMQKEPQEESEEEES